MEQNIQIASIDIDVDNLIQNASEVRRRILEIQSEISALKEKFKKGEISVQEYTEQLTELNAIQRENQRELRSYDSLISSHIGQQSQAMQANRTLSGSIRELGSALAQNKRIYEDLSEAQRNSTEGRELLALIQQQDASYRELQRSIGTTQVEVGNYRQAILDALGDQDAFGFSLNSINQYFQNLKGRISALLAPFMNFVQTGNIATTAMNATATATGKSSIALKLFRGALLSTGIGAIIVALASLVAYFTSTQEGIDKVNKVLTPLKVVFETLKGILQNVGTALANAFSNTTIIKDFGKVIKDVVLFPIEQIIASVKALGKVFTLDFKGAWQEVSKPVRELGKDVAQMASSSVQLAKDISKGFEGSADAIKTAWERGQKLADIQSQLSKSEADFIEQTSKLKEEFKAQNKIVEDTTKSFAEREKNALQALDTLKKSNDLARERNSLELTALQLKMESTATTDADRTEIAKKIAELQEQNASFLEAETTMNNKLNQIRKSRNDEAIKLQEEAKKRQLEEIAEQQTLLEAYVKTNSAVAQSLQERLQIEEDAKNKRLALLEQEQQLGKYSQSQYQLEKTKIETEFLQIRAELSTEAVQKEIELFEQANQSKITNETILTEEIITQEQQRLQSILEMKLQALEQEKQLKQEAREWDYNQEAEYQAKIQALKTDFNQQNIDLDTQSKTQQKENEKIQEELDFAEKIAKITEQGDAEWEVKYANLDKEHSEETAKIEELHNQGKLSNEQYQQALLTANTKYANAKKKLDEEVETAKVQGLQASFSQAKQLFGEHTAVGKAAAIAEATINTYLGITKALSAYPPPYNYIVAGITGAMGLKNVQKIMETKTKYAQGGLVTGKSHAQGGIPFSVAGVGGYEMEGNEYIINKKATAKWFPLLEFINKDGRTASPSPRFFAQGGMVKPISVNDKIDYSALTEAVRQGAEQGSFNGAMSGSLEGTKIGSLEGTAQGALEGATLGTSTAILENSQRTQRSIQPITATTI